VAVRASQRAGGVGDVDGEAHVFAPFPDRFPATVSEARAVERTIADASVVLGSEATEASVRRAFADAGTVHLATHGVMNARSPMFSRIELATGENGAGSDDGRLEVHEVLTLRIRSSLVFLSGCETGLGAAWSTGFAEGEDYATLDRAFLSAGVSAVIATLWRIEDEGAAAFASRFYEELEAASPPEALARAQRRMLGDRRYEAPFYWAAYRLSSGSL
jgi:CHAT domain-containing protein